jgi:hypothetical protein
MYFPFVQSLLSFDVLAWGVVLKSILEPLNITQKLILQIGFGKPRRYPSDILNRDLSILTIRQLFIKSVLIYIFTNFNSIFNLISHIHHTRYSSRVEKTFLQIYETFSTTNSFYISHVLYRNLRNNFQELDHFNLLSLNIFKRRVNEWLVALGRDKAERFILSDYRRSLHDST